MFGNNTGKNIILIIFFLFCAYILSFCGHIFPPEKC